MSLICVSSSFPSVERASPILVELNMFQLFCSYFSLSELKWHPRAFGYYPKLITDKNDHPNGCLVGVGIGSADEMLKARIFLLVSNSFNEASRSRRGLWFEVMGIHVCWFWQTIPIFKHVRDYFLCPYCFVSSCHFFNFFTTVQMWVFSSLLLELPKLASSIYFTLFLFVWSVI